MLKVGQFLSVSEKNDNLFLSVDLFGFQVYTQKRVGTILPLFFPNLFLTGRDIYIYMGCVERASPLFHQPQKNRKETPRWRPWPRVICPKLLSIVFNGDCLMQSQVSGASRPVYGFMFSRYEQRCSFYINLMWQTQCHTPTICG